jgi:hypothetical protein
VCHLHERGREAPQAVGELGVLGDQAIEAIVVPTGLASDTGPGEPPTLVVNS